MLVRRSNTHRITTTEHSRRLLGIAASVRQRSCVELIYCDATQSNTLYISDIVEVFSRKQMILNQHQLHIFKLLRSRICVIIAHADRIADVFQPAKACHTSVYFTSFAVTVRVTWFVRHGGEHGQWRSYFKHWLSNEQFALNRCLNSTACCLGSRLASIGQDVKLRTHLYSQTLMFNLLFTFPHQYLSALEVLICIAVRFHFEGVPPLNSPKPSFFCYVIQWFSSSAHITSLRGRAFHCYIGRLNSKGKMRFSTSQLGKTNEYCWTQLGRRD